MLIGVDIGGTFTDLVASIQGQLVVHKLLSTPQDPSIAMLAGLSDLSPDGLAAISRVSHGSTVATNAILERNGAPTALITTQGFRDLLFIGRQNRPALYALHPQFPPPLIPRRFCYEVPERLDHAGQVLVSLDLDALDAAIQDMLAQGICSVAVCFLFSYVNPAHELAVYDRLLAHGFAPEQVALSSRVLPEFREYERASTVALEAYVRPVMSRYLGRLAESLPRTCLLRMMKSDGGIFGAQRARTQSIHTALSGPAAGVIGAFHLAKLAGYDQIMTMDIGGTSTDVALCPGELIWRAESEIDGLPLRTRLLDIETIGAGGGSIARLDAGGALHVGPESAGADPGPICYDQGGTRVTVSDAHAVLGRLDERHFLGGRMRLDMPAAREAVTVLARRMSMTPEQAAQGILDVANANIDRALRRVSVARGYDPRSMVLMPFGGAGPMHACTVAERLGMRRILVPRYPGLLCALGLLVADVVLEYSRSLLGILDQPRQALLETQLADLIATARHDLAQEGLAEDAMRFQGMVDMRYRGQSYELTVLFAAGAAGQLAADFAALHERRYGHALPDRPVEVVNLRLQAVGVIPKPPFDAAPLLESDGSEALLGSKRAVCGDGTEHGISLYDRPRLPPGARFAGPALVFQMDSTTFIAPGWTARVDVYRNIILEVRP